MFKRLKRKIRAWLADDSMELVQLTASRDSEYNRSLNGRSMTFNLYRADGGWIVETRNIELAKGLHATEPEYRLRIVTPDQDLGQTLGEIVLMANLRA